jgi:hypothetical protein
MYLLRVTVVLGQRYMLSASPDFDAQTLAK